MPLSQPLTKFTTASPAIATFSFEEIAGGVKFITFYPLVTEDNSGIQYSLADNTINYSSIRESGRTSAGTTTYTFDSSEFELTRTIRGTAYLSLGVYHNLDAAAANVYAARLYKWNGSSATAITAEVVLTVEDGVVETIFSFQMPCTETIIAQGEQLRLTIRLLQSAGVTGKMLFGHDPKNLDAPNISPSSADTITSTRINVPTKID